MPHYYFHLEDGQILLDDTGVELLDRRVVWLAVLRNPLLRLHHNPREDVSRELLAGGTAFLDDLLLER
jgi:hypothetical protein